MSVPRYFHSLTLPPLLHATPRHVAPTTFDLQIINKPACFVFLANPHHLVPTTFNETQYAPFLALPGGLGETIGEGLTSGRGYQGTVFRMSLRTRPGDISGSKCTVDAVEREVQQEMVVGGKVAVCSLQYWLWLLWFLRTPRLVDM